VLLFTHKTGDFGAISVTERSCAALISKVTSHIRDGCSYFRVGKKSYQVSVNIAKENKPISVNWYCTLKNNYRQYQGVTIISSNSFKSFDGF